MDAGVAGGRADHEGSSDRKPDREGLTLQVLMALVAVAALVVSIAGIVWAKQSADAAKQSAAAARQANALTEQADQSAARTQAMAQASEVSFSFLRETTDQVTTSYVQVLNLSTNNIRDVYLTYTSLWGPDYVYVDLVKPCSGWQAEDDNPYPVQLYFEDQSGHYWELNTSGTLVARTGPPDLAKDTPITGWHTTEISPNCVA